MAELHSERWPSDDPSLDELDTFALEGHPGLAGFFVAVGRLLSPDDELAVSRLGAGILQDWLWMADKRHPQALNVITDVLRQTPAITHAISDHMMLDHRDLRSSAGQRLSGQVQTFAGRA